MLDIEDSWIVLFTILCDYSITQPWWKQNTKIYNLEGEHKHSCFMKYSPFLKGKTPLHEVTDKRRRLSKTMKFSNAIIDFDAILYSSPWLNVWNLAQSLLCKMKIKFETKNCVFVPWVVFFFSFSHIFTLSITSFFLQL